MMRARPKALLSAFLGLSLIAVVTGGCVSRDISDLEEFVEQIKARPGGAP